MNLRELIDVDAAVRSGLLQRAACLAERLPDADGRTWITLAFERDRELLAASIVACWLRGHGAAVCENALRDRIQPVLDHERSAMLLHDTPSGRTLQVARLLEGVELPAAPPELPELTMRDALAVHVQNDDGAQTWCTWSPRALAAAIDALPEADDVDGERREYTPGFLPALFHNCLRPLRRGAAAAEASTPVGLRAHLAGAPDNPPATFPDGVARDPNGQVLLAEWHLQQGLGRRGQQVTRELVFAAQLHDDGAATVRTTLPRDYLFFEGHFEGYPVLAGGVQLHNMLLPALRALCGELPDVTALDGLKFLARMAPGDDIDIRLEPNDDRTRVSFAFVHGERRCTVGRVTFAAALPAFSPTAR